MMSVLIVKSLKKRISTLELTIDSLEKRLSLPNDKGNVVLNNNNLDNNLGNLTERLRLLEIQIKENEDIVNARKITEDLKELLFYPSDIDTINTLYPRLDSLITFFTNILIGKFLWLVILIQIVQLYNIDLSKRRSLK